MVAAYQAGATVRSLSQQFVVHEQTVRAHVRRAGVELGQLRALTRTSRNFKPCAVIERATWRSVRRLNAAQIEQLVADYQAGRTVYELAAHYGINRKTVSKQLHGQGVTMRMGGLLPAQIDQAVRL